MMTKLRILTPLHSFEPGGVERVALRLNAEWQRHGIEAMVVMGRDVGAMGAGDPPARYQVFGQPAFSTAPFETLWMILRLPGAIRRLRPDVLFCAGNTYAVVMVAMRLLLGRHCPPIVAKVSNDLTRNDMPPVGRWLYRSWLRLQGRIFSMVVGMAEPMRAEIGKAMGVAPSAIKIVEDAALSSTEVASLARPRPTTSRGRRFIAAGRLAPQKNFPLMLRAFGLGSRPDDRLTIIGEGPERGILKRLIGELHLDGRVTMPGHRQSVADDFAQADYFLLSSDYEGVPAVIIEALAAGLPIVATDCSVSMGHLLGNDRFGLRVTIGDVAGFAHALEAITSVPYVAGDAQRHAARFTVERAAVAYLQVFEAVSAPCAESIENLAVVEVRL